MNIKLFTPEAPGTERAPDNTEARLLDRRRPAADQIYRALRDDIISGRFRPAEAISEMRVCGLFGVSRSPVRIALTRLVEDGLIDIFPQRGSFVAPIKLRQVQESQFARTALEIALVEVAARRWTREHSREAHANMDAQRQHAASGQTLEFYLDNERFHQLISRSADLEGVWKTVQGVKMFWDRIGHIANRVAGHRDEIIAEHAAIVDALDRNDEEAAIGAMRQHLDSLHTTIARLKLRHEDYFVED